MRTCALAIVAAAVAVLAPSSAAAQQPVAADFFSSTRSVRVSGDLAYAVSAAGLTIYDISDRANPRQLSQLFLGKSGSFKIEVSGDYAYVLAGEIVFEESLVRVVDVSDPLAPHVVAEYSDVVDSRVQAMLVAGPILALANANAVDLVDISDPASPAKLSSLPIVSEPEQIVGLAVDGSTLFAAWIGLGGDDLTGGVTSIDISDPSAPAEIAVFGLEGTPTSMTAVGDTLYVGEILTAVVVLDASDPAQIVEANRIDFPFTGQVDVFAEGDRLFTGASTDDFRIVRVGVFDITNPLAPVSLGETEQSCQVVGMAYDADRSDAFMGCLDASGSGMTILDVPASGEVAPIASVLVPEVRGVKVSASGTTFLAASDALYAVAPGTGGRVEVLGRLSLEQGAYRLQIVGGRAYVFTADNTIGTNGHIRIVDVTDPASMSLLGSLAVGDLGVVFSSKRFYVEGETLYLAEPEGLVIYDVSDPAEPTQLGVYETPTPAENVVVADGIAYVNTLRVAENIIRVDLYVVKVKKPARPKLRGRLLDLDMATFASDLAVRDGRLYVLDSGQGNPFGVAGDGRILVVDVRKKRPRLLSESSTTPSRNGYAREIRLAGDVAYVADGLDGVSVLSLAGDDGPEYLRGFDTPGFAVGIEVDGDGNLLVADQSSYQVYAPDGEE